ncbi:MAG: riboflavin synthase [Corynebacterium sp.]|nr:riboflavin synthase [Corynebacterium sp.]
MFSGIVEARGSIADQQWTGPDFLDLRVTVPASILEGVSHGDSIAINGVCLTVTDFGTDWFSADVMKETLDRTNLGQCTKGSIVNVERALPANGRLNGHIVQGHVDCVTTLLSITPGTKWSTYTFALPSEVAKYIVLKGSVTINGTSLTVSGLSDGETPSDAAENAGAKGTPYFQVSLIPTTLAETNLGELEPGAVVNIEVDILAKYVERLLAGEKA